MKVNIQQGTVSKVVDANQNDNVLDLLQKHSFFVSAACGRRGICQNCMVLIDGIKVRSCQSVISKDCTIVVPEQQLSDQTSIPKMKPNQVVAMAIDIGTTTIAFYLIDIKHQTILLEQTKQNHQQVYGADVISRIAQASHSLIKMQELILTQIKEQINEWGLTEQTIKEIIVSGNTTMNHLLLGVDPTSMGKAPYLPQFINQIKLEGSKLGLECEKVTILPGKSAFIGGDIMSGLYYTRFFETKKSILYVDLGTNGEIVFRHQNQIVATSAAAGPALEGANISCGVGGVVGAINHIDEEGNVYTIQNQKPIGICGSGLIDAIAFLRRKNIIDESGSFQQGNAYALTEQFQITQNDIHQFQFAKSAVYSAILTLLEEVNSTMEQVEEIWVAGGLGMQIHIPNAIQIGLFHPAWEHRFRFVGNASGLGAVCYSMDCNRQQAFQWIDQIQVIDLASNLKFANRFIEQLQIG